MRIVATLQEAVVVDPTGRLAGRGTYVCKAGICVHQGLKRARLEYALRTKLKDEDWIELLSAVEALSDSVEGAHI